jgi:CxxC motif-containing protein
MGCRMAITKIDDEFKVEGNTCKRGGKYGIQEITAPKRMVTSTIKIEGSVLNMLPVKTSDSIPKEMIFDLMDVLNKLRVNAPIKMGDIMIEDVLGTGVNIVATRSIKKIS